MSFYVKPTPDGKMYKYYNMYLRVQYKSTPFHIPLLGTLRWGFDAVSSNSSVRDCGDYVDINVMDWVYNVFLLSFISVESQLGLR